MSLFVVLRDPMQIAYGIPPLLRVGLASGIVGSGLALLTGALSAGAFVWFLHTWNLLGFRY